MPRSQVSGVGDGSQLRALAALPEDRVPFPAPTWQGMIA